jgi:hypothetical protein
MGLSSKHSFRKGDDVDDSPDQRVGAVDKFDEVELTALTLLALGALDDAESERLDQPTGVATRTRSRPRFEVHPVLGFGIVLVLGLAIWWLFRSGWR